MLKSNRLILNGIDKVTDEYESWLNDPEIIQYMETARSKVLTRTELEHWLEKTNNDPDMRYWGIYVRHQKLFVDDDLKICKRQWIKDIIISGEKLIGTIKLHINWIHRHADIGIMIGDKTEWGKGYASEAIGLVKDYAFNVLNLHKLWAGIYENNPASLKAFIRNGFEREGLLIEHRFCNGEYIGQYIMGRLNGIL